jgi:hypothetical protein
MADQPDHIVAQAPLRPSRAVAERARNVLSRAPVSSPIQLSAFAIGAGLLAGLLIKRTKPRR